MQTNAFQARKAAEDAKTSWRKHRGRSDDGPFQEAPSKLSGEMPLPTQRPEAAWRSRSPATKHGIPVVRFLPQSCVPPWCE